MPSATLGTFPSPRPSDLQTVPCCYPCNNGASQDDEYFRLAVSSMLDRSLHGERIWNESIVPSTFRKRRIGHLIDELARESGPAMIRTPFGNVPATAMPFRCDEIKRVLLRITKGFLFLTHPEVDSAPLDYRVTMIQQFRFVEMAQFLNHSFPYFELGGGVFRMWHGLDDTDLRHGIWFYLFTTQPDSVSSTAQMNNAATSVMAFEEWNCRLAIDLLQCGGPPHLQHAWT